MRDEMTKWTKGLAPFLIGLTLASGGWFVVTGNAPWGSIITTIAALVFYAGRYSMARAQGSSNVG